jgi:hypothetical protein
MREIHRAIERDRRKGRGNSLQQTEQVKKMLSVKKCVGWLALAFAAVTRLAREIAAAPQSRRGRRRVECFQAFIRKHKRTRGEISPCCPCFMAWTSVEGVGNMSYRRNQQNMLPTPQCHRRKRFTNKSHVAASKAGAIDPMAFLTRDVEKVDNM